MRPHNLALFICAFFLFIAEAAYAQSRYVIPFVWQPTPNHPKYILPASSTDSKYSVARHYLRTMRSHPALGQYISGSGWEELTFSSPAFPLNTSHRAPRLLLVANKHHDHEINHWRLKEHIPKYERLGFEVYVLPVGALKRFDDIEKKRFLDHIGSGFSAIVPLGGDDTHPSLWGHPITFAVEPNFERDQEEVFMYRYLYSRSQIHFLGICRGAQILAASLGIPLYQDVFHEGGATIEHREGSEHPLIFSDTPDNFIFELFGKRQDVLVNSYHHQSVILAKDHPRLVLGATSPDGITEAAYTPDRRMVLIQSHPERPDSRNDGEVFLSRWAHHVLQKRHSKTPPSCDQLLKSLRTTNTTESQIKTAG